MLSSRLLAGVERRIQETRLPLAVRLSVYQVLAGKPLVNGALWLPAARDDIYAR